MCSFIGILKQGQTNLGEEESQKCVYTLAQFRHPTITRKIHYKSIHKQLR